MEHALRPNQRDWIVLGVELQPFLGETFLRTTGLHESQNTWAKLAWILRIKCEIAKLLVLLVHGITEARFYLLLGDLEHQFISHNLKMSEVLSEKFVIANFLGLDKSLELRFSEDSQWHLDYWIGKLFAVMINL